MCGGPSYTPNPVAQITTDFVALLDEWAARFFDELDYVKEGRNATLFAAQMAKDLPQVCVCVWLGVLWACNGRASDGGTHQPNTQI